MDGKYRGHDGQVHSAKHDVYTVFSLWDTFRAAHPLFTLLEPDRTLDFINTFLLQYAQSGRLPVWELWGNETDCMIGYHSVSVIADAYLKGLRGFDADLALEAMVASAMRDEPGLNAYRAQGYISSEDQSESVSRTLEYAYDDWCIAQMAKAMGKDSLASAFLDRAANWRNVFDPATGFFRARHNGGFKEPFDPYEVNFDFTEANAWQYSSFVPHDVEGLDRALQAAGKGGLEQRLDALFSASPATTGRSQSDITGMIGQYAHGNEPSHAMAWMYQRAGRADKAKQMVDTILHSFYRDAPDGLIGNEDCGQMSAWYVLSALGLYPIAPGDPSFALQAPLFHGYRIHLPDGKAVNVRCSGALSGARLIKSTQLNGEEGRLQALPFPALAGGMDLQLELTPMWRPFDTEAPPMPVLQGAYARDLDQRYPPSAPVITASARAFTAPMEISISTLRPTDQVFYTVDGSTPNRNSLPYRAPFTIGTSTVVKAVALSPGEREASPVITARYTQIYPERTITVESAWSTQYAAGGEAALIDGVRGGADWRTGGWQGYLGRDATATVDLGSVKQLQRLGLSVLQDQRSWIWYPAEVQFAWSTNGRNWSSATVEHTVARDAEGVLTMELRTELLDKQARYIKVIARNPGPCPAGHPGQGDPSFIFTDELLIEVE